MKMRHTLILQITLVLLVAGSVWAVDPSLVAWYQFDESWGTTAYDSARHHDATIYDAAWTTGKVGGALSFDGWSSYVAADDDPELNITGDITIGAWVNFFEGGLMYDGSEKAIVTKCVANGAFGNPYDFRTDISIEPRLAMVRADDFEHEVTYSASGISLDTWHHVAVRVENMVTDFYLDGVLMGKSAPDPRLTNPPTGNDFRLLIGARDDGFFFNGLIDDVRIYNRALSGEEIRNIPEPCSLMLIGLGSLIASRLTKRRSGR
jgi:hypothetical protein